jgi:hypothetical protein
VLFMVQKFAISLEFCYWDHRRVIIFGIWDIDERAGSFAVLPNPI